MEPTRVSAGRGRGLASWSSSPRVAAAVVVLVTLAHWLPRLRGPIDLRYDAGVYYVLGTSLAEGRGYRLLNEPGAIEAIQYPPLLPATIALVQKVCGSSDPAVVGRVLRAASALLALGYGLLLLALARRILDPPWALFAALAASLTFHTVFLEDLCFTEVPFASLCVAFFLAQGSPRPAARALAPLLAAATFFLRSAGIALFAAWTMAELVQRRWRVAAVSAGVALACVLAWQGHVVSVRGDPAYRQPAYAYQRAPYLFYNVSYSENLGLRDPFRPEDGRLAPTELVGRSLRASGPILLGLGETVSTTRGFWEWMLALVRRRIGGPPAVLAVVPVVLFGLAALAGLACLARRQPLLVAHAVATLALVSTLPWPSQTTRYLMPLAPVLALALAEVLARVAALWPRLAKPVAAIAVLVLAVQAFALERTFTHYRHAVAPFGAAPGAPPTHYFLFEEARAWRAFQAAVAWIAREAPAEAVVATSSPQLVWLETGRRAVMPPFEADPVEAARLLEAVPVDYVIVDELAFLDVTRRYALPAVERASERWERVQPDPAEAVRLYRRRR